LTVAVSAVSASSVSIPQWVSSGVLLRLNDVTLTSNEVSIPQWVSSGVLRAHTGFSLPMALSFNTPVGLIWSTTWLQQRRRRRQPQFQYPSGSHLEYYKARVSGKYVRVFQYPSGSHLEYYQRYGQALVGTGRPTFQYPSGSHLEYYKETRFPWSGLKGFNTPVGLIWSTTKLPPSRSTTLVGFNNPVGLIWSTTDRGPMVDRGY